jgi:hypothetical protein
VNQFEMMQPHLGTHGYRNHNDCGSRRQPRARRASCSTTERGRGVESVRAVRLMVKRILFGLVATMIFAGLCFSSTLPAFRSRVAEDQESVMPAKVSVKSASRNAVTPHGPRIRVAGRSKSSSSASRTAKSFHRETAQTTAAQTGCQDFTPAKGAAAVLGKNSTAGKTNDNSQEKKLCNTESTRSR